MRYSLLVTLLVVNGCGHPANPAAPPPVQTFAVDVEAGPATPPVDWVAVAGAVDGTPFFTTAIEGTPLLVGVDLAGKQQASGVAIAASRDGLHLAQATATMAVGAGENTLTFTLGDDALADEPMPIPAGPGGDAPELTVDHPLLRLHGSPAVPATADVVVSNVGAAPAPLTLKLAAQTEELTVSGCEQSSLLGGTSCTLHVTFAPTRSDGGTAGGIFIDAGQRTVQTVLVSATRAANPTLTMSPATLAFGASGVGEQTASQVVQITNDGGVTTTALRDGLAGADAQQFTIVIDGCRDQKLAPGKSCGIAVAAAPSHAGAIRAQLVVDADVGGSASATLTTSALLSHALTLTGMTDFGAVRTGGRGVDGHVTVTNSGYDATGALTVTAPASDSHAYGTVVNDTCTGKSLPSGGTCTFEVDVTPHAAGSYSAVVTVAGSAGATVSQAVTATIEDHVVTVTVDGQTVSETGMLMLPSAAPPGGAFTKTITLTNVGTAPVRFPNPGASVGTVDNGCTVVLAPQASCSAKWTVGPFAFGAALETTIETTGGVDGFVRVGQWYSDLQASTAELYYLDGADQVVTLTNVSANDVAGVTATLKDTSNVTMVSHCGATLAAHASCTINVHFVVSAPFDDLVLAATGEGSFDIGIVY